LKNAKLARDAAKRSDTLDSVEAELSTSRAGAAKTEIEKPDEIGPDRFSSFSAEESVAEFRELATSAGAEVVGEFIQKRDKPDPATLIGKGKLQEIAAAAASAHADLILFDHDLSPSQQRNIEREVSARVIDRTQLILDIFARHARTREGQLQVELAQLQYLLPRLAGRGIEMSQLGGGIGTRGPGETQLETDRRKIARRMRHIKDQVEEVRRIRAQQRQRRESLPVATIALVGYTNAGKSTLFNALTNAGVVASSKMFATLDPTIRAVTLPSKRKVLLSDTVGFIRNLPHTLVTSFRATLEEVQRSALVLHVSDASAPAYIAAEQQAQVEKVLKELEAQNKPVLRVMNKVDLLPENQRATVRENHEIVPVSALNGIGLTTLLQKIDDLLTDDPIVIMHLRVPQTEGKVLAQIEAQTHILSRSFRAGNVHMEVQGPESYLRTLERFSRIR
jgi:GTP-binding protein HflX